MFFASLALVAFIAAALTVHRLQPHALRLGLVDHPDEARKHHDTPTPLVGGLGVLAGLLAASLVALLTGQLALRDILAFGAAAVPLALLGILDDRLGLSARLRLVVQIAAACVVVYFGGVTIGELGDLIGSGSPIVLDTWAVPLTLVCIVGAINAFNMIDGVDGLSGGIALAALGWYAIVGAHQGAMFETALAFMAIGAIIGFLLFNARHPLRAKASVFLGSSGSMLLGLIVVWLAISLTQRTQSGPQPHFPAMMSVWVLGVPLLDCLATIAIRLAQGKSPLSPDRNHVHHRLLATGLSERQTVALMIMAAILFGGIGFGAWRAGLPESVLFYGSFATYLAYLLAVYSGQLRQRAKRDETSAENLGEQALGTPDRP